MSNSEQPKYKVLLSKDKIELREYASMILAEVEMPGDRQEAIKEGFKALADFIFGNNALKQKMAMTTPVMQTEHMKKWKVRFFMPSQYSLKTLPRPSSKEVMLIQEPVKCFAVITFSGTPNHDSLTEHTQELLNYIATENIKMIGKPIYCFYNPPWTAPFLRRNEVMIEIESKKDESKL